MPLINHLVLKLSKGHASRENVKNNDFQILNSQILFPKTDVSENVPVFTSALHPLFTYRHTSHPYQVWSSVSRSVVSNSLWPHGLQHTWPPCPSPVPRTCSNSCPLSQWCHPTISSSVVPFSSCLQSFSASESFPMTQFFTSDGQSIGTSASASVLPGNIQD